MSELITLDRIGRSSSSRPVAPTHVELDAFDLGPDNIREHVRTLLGSGWTKQVVLRGESRTEIVAAAIDAARDAGRGVTVVTARPLSELPLAAEGEKWATKEADGKFTHALMPRRPELWKAAVKRSIDVVVSAMLLLLLSPALLAIAIAIRLHSDGPVFYPWRVLGEHGRPFVGYKFRTMVPNADALKPHLQHLNERLGPVFKMANDPRVTSVGRLLRKYSVDELPQLWSVLVGDMSLVGPRPIFASEYKKCELWQMRKLSVKPGLTCLWQLDGRSTITDFSDWARLDLHYIDTWSLWKDLTILFRTPVAVIKGTGH